MMPKLQTRNPVTVDAMGRPVRPNMERRENVETRAICGCGYQTSWVQQQSNAIVLYEQHKVVHRGSPS